MAWLLCSFGLQVDPYLCPGFIIHAALKTSGTSLAPLFSIRAAFETAGHLLHPIICAAFETARTPLAPVIHAAIETVRALLAPYYSCCIRDSRDTSCTFIFCAALETAKIPLAPLFFMLHSRLQGTSCTIKASPVQLSGWERELPGCGSAPPQVHAGGLAP